MFMDKLLIELYVENDVPCDQLVSDPESLCEFTKQYAERSGQDVKPKEVSKRMLNLRRRGQDKGGLPRLRRSYNGRNEWRV